MPKKLFKNILFEIGTEEIPARFLPDASRQLWDLILNGLKDQSIPVDFEKIKRCSLFTPRRLTVFIPNLPDRQDDRTEKIKGPPTKIAYQEDGTLSEIAQAFAKRQQVSLNQLLREMTPRGEYLFVQKVIKGERLEKILPEILMDVLSKLRFPKSMRWGNQGMKWARPLRWILALCGSNVIRFDYKGIRSGNKSLGHRILSKTSLSIIHADLNVYEAQLKKAGVIVDFEKRKKIILEKISKVLGSNQNIIIEDHALVDEVTNLVEWPEVSIGSYDKEYLVLPDEILITAMRHHQRYFAVFNKKGAKIQPNFLVVYNGSKEIEKNVVRGNQRILKARLSDAAFFWHEDSKKTLEVHIPQLKQLLFQESLGSYFDKTERLRKLVKSLAARLGFGSDQEKLLERACRLSKADLVTEMVKEHPILQGTMGKLYALASQEQSDVAIAIGEQYLPLTGSDGPIAVSRLGRHLAVIDKIDTLVGSFHAGLESTGSKDPYGLRRTGSGLLRTLYEAGINLDLEYLINESMRCYNIQGPGPYKKVIKFLRERLVQLFLARGFDYDLVDAVNLGFLGRPYQAYQILEALSKARKKPFFMKAVRIIERTHNITKHAEITQDRVDEKLLKEPEEIELYRNYQSLYDNFSRLVHQGKYVEATELFAGTFEKSVHLFFDKVLVNADELSIRQNRLILLKQINVLYTNAIADLAKIVN